MYLRFRDASNPVHTAKRQECFSRIITEYKRFVEHENSARIFARQSRKLDSFAMTTALVQNGEGDRGGAVGEETRLARESYGMSNRCTAGAAGE